jgi:hypothetical protein
MDFRGGSGAFGHRFVPRARGNHVEEIIANVTSGAYDGNL